MAYTPAPPIDRSKLDFGQFNQNLQQTAAPAPNPVAAPPYSGTTSGYQPSTSPPAYNGTTSGYRPSAPYTATPAPPMPPTATPKPQAQATQGQAQKVPGGWMTADGQFVPVPNATPAPPRPQEPPNYQFQPMPQTATPAPQMQQPTAAPVYKDPYARTPESIAALAKERVQKILQAGKTAAGGALTGAKNAYDYTNQIEGDTRTLRNAQFKETSNPFSGNTGYQAANMQRNDSIQDTSQDKDYNAQVGLINQKLADLEAAAPGDEQAIIDQLQQIERQTGISVAQLQEQQRQNAFSNNMQTNQFNRGVYESDRGFNYGVNRDQVGDSRYADKTQYDRGRDAVTDNRLADQTAYGRSRDSVADTRYDDKTQYDRGQDKITNDRNVEADKLVLRNQHIAEANALSAKYGITVNPTDDYQLMLDQVAGLPTVAQQSAAQKQETDQKTEAWKVVEMLGSVPSYLADILGVPAGTQTQKAKEAAMDDAYKNRSANISQQNADAATSNAATNAQNATTNANKAPTEKTQDYSKDISRISELYVTPGQYGGQAKVNNPTAMRNAIIALGMEDDLTDRYLAMYGLPINQ